MKKFFIVLSALAALMLCVVPAQALVGSPDDVPGCDAVVPFICDRSLTSGLNTLITFQDVRAGFNPSGTRTTYAGVYHYTVNTVASVTVHDANLTGSPRAVINTNAMEILTAASVAAKAALEVTIAGADYYAGYIHFKNLMADYTTATPNVNSVVGQFFFVHLAAGKAAAANIPMKEYADVGGTDYTGSADIVNANMLDALVANPGGNRTLDTVNDANTELFSAQALQAAIDLQAGSTAASAPTTFYIFPRVFVADADASNWWLFWSSANDLPTATTIHVNIYNENEFAISSNIPLDDELEIVDTETYLPSGLWTAYPYSGYVDLHWTTSTAALQVQEFLGWSYLQATGTASESWTVLTPMPRDVD
jgi:hypothetical protein